MVCNLASCCPKHRYENEKDHNGNEPLHSVGGTSYHSTRDHNTMNRNTTDHSSMNVYSASSGHRNSDPSREHPRGYHHTGLYALYRICGNGRVCVSGNNPPQHHYNPGHTHNHCFYMQAPTALHTLYRGCRWLEHRQALSHPRTESDWCHKNNGGYTRPDHGPQ